MNILNLHMDTRKRVPVYVESFDHRTWNRLATVPADELKATVEQLKSGTEKTVAAMINGEIVVQ